MISDRVLDDLVPNDYDFLRYETVETSRDRRRIAAWSSLVEGAVRRTLSEERTGQLAASPMTAVAVGVFRVSDSVSNERAAEGSPFPIVEGMRFGVAYLYLRLPQGEESLRRREDALLETISVGPYAVPIFHLAIQPELFSRHGDGQIAAYFSEDGATCGLTAKHVVAGRLPGVPVAVNCPHDYPTRLKRVGFGHIDAAVVELPCDPEDELQCRPIRPAQTGDTVLLHSQGRVEIKATVMSTVHLPSELLTSVMPKHFIMDRFGRYGDSGSLVDMEFDGALAGIFLGAANCEDPSKRTYRYGYALDFSQAAFMLNVSEGTVFYG